MLKSFVIACMVLLVAGCERREASAPPTPARVTTTLADLERQLLAQVREQWPGEKLETVQIRSFERERGSDAFITALKITWDPSHNSLGNVTLFPAAQRYYLGTLHIEGKPAAVNLVLAFD